MSNEALYDEELETSADDDYEEVVQSEEAYEDSHSQDESDWQSHTAEHAAHAQQDDTETPAAEPLDPLDQLPMALTLRCGSLNLTLGDLRRVAEGTVLEVSGVTPGFATLCHGERIVAEGELVDVEGRLGLQITRMASPA